MLKKLNITKRNIFILIIGLFLGTSITGVVAYSVYANNVTYDNTNSGLQSTEVQGAIDELYTRTNQLNTYKDLQCPGCVYRKSSDTKANSTSAYADGTNNVLSPSEYTTDYKTLNSNYFLGHVIDANGYILSSYVCGINNGVFFCLRGVDSDQSSLTYKTFKEENANIMNKVFPGCNASTSSSTITCAGDVTAVTGSSGNVRVAIGSSNYCIIYNVSASSCY